MRHIVLLLAASCAGCGFLTGAGELGPRSDFEREAGAADLRVREDRAKAGLVQLESAIADYVKSQKSVPPSLEALVPRYIAEIPTMDLPACGRETDRVVSYGPDVLRGGQVDGSRIKGGGGWGYVYNDDRVVVFVDCVKPSSRGTPWYQERGAY